jgi:drug/metabolite transporter (DMT)-like permease
MGILFGALAAVMFGASDVFAAHASRSLHSIAVTRTALLVALIFTPLFLVLKPFSLSGADIAYAIISGVLIGSSLLCLYVAYGRASIGIVAPLVSVLTACVPLLIDLFRGKGLSLVSGIGALIGIVAVAFSTYHPGGRGNMRVGLLLGLAAGVGIGLSFEFLDLTADTAGLAPVPIQRLSGLIFLTLAMPFVKAPWLVTKRPARWPAIATGLMAGLAMGSLQLGYRYGSGGPVSVAASQFAAAAVLISAVVYRDRFRWWQGVGLAMASVGVALMALG